jgi:hypothetical protein
MKYFGPHPVDALLDGMERIDPPMCAPCTRCGEPITRTDEGYAIPIMGQPLLAGYHRACFLRGIFGSVAHQQKKCFCFGGVGEDDPNLTVREAALAAVAYFERRK